MKKLFNLFALGFSSICMLSSCSSSEFEGYEKNSNGLYFKFYKKAENLPKPKVNDEVQMIFTLKIKSNDSLLTDSRKLRVKDGIVTMQMRTSTFKGSLEEAIMMMSTGDSASFIISADSFFLKTQTMKQLPPFLKPGEKLIAQIKLVNLTDAKIVEENRKKQMEEMKKKMLELEMKSKTDLEKYLTDNKITVKPTASGMYYIETKKGSGPKVLLSDTVSVYYKGMFLDGTVFNDNTKDPKPIEFPVQGLIPAWQEAIPMMNVGTKVKLICPPQVAYGANGNQGIPPYSNLIFEIEVMGKKSAEASKNKSIK
ncbi:MAG: FKBP-type peptidyl-prolyl cis-trans isomerase [Bacteroidota bacterium]|jgi:FKBP-type peptidyl-prolyl cis-trans isomerase FkpA